MRIVGNFTLEITQKALDMAKELAYSYNMQTIQGGQDEESTVSNERGKSPIFQALARHLQEYDGLLEPRQEIAAVALKGPQRDDL